MSQVKRGVGGLRGAKKQLEETKTVRDKTGPLIGKMKSVLSPQGTPRIKARYSVPPGMELGLAQAQARLSFLFEPLSVAHLLEALVMQLSRNPEFRAHFLAYANDETKKFRMYANAKETTVLASAKAITWLMNEMEASASQSVTTCLMWAADQLPWLIDHMEFHLEGAQRRLPMD